MLSDKSWSYRSFQDVYNNKNQLILSKIEYMKKMWKNTLNTECYILIFENGLLHNKLKIILNLFGNDVSNISKMLTNEYDKKNLDNIAIWLNNPRNILNKLIDYYENDPETFLIMIKKKVNKL